MKTQELAPPANRYAERALLAAMLHHPDCIKTVTRFGISKQSFHFFAHRLVFEAITDLLAHGNPATLVSVFEWLTLRHGSDGRPLIDEVGGHQTGHVFLAKLFDDDPTAANATHYARIVQDKARLRQLVRFGDRLARRAQSQTMPSADLAVAARDFLDKAVAALGESGGGESPSS